MRKMKRQAILAGLVAGCALLGVTGCFETSDRSIRKLRVFYSSDLVGGIEPCG